MVERWADGEPTVAYSIDVPAVADPDAWIVAPVPSGPATAVARPPSQVASGLGWFVADDVVGRQRGLDAGLVGSIIELGPPGGIAAVSDTIAAGRYAPLGIRPWVAPEPEPADPVRHRAVANEMLATMLAVVDPGWMVHLDALAELDGVDGVIVRRDRGHETAELEDAVIECCDATGLTPGLAFGSHGVAAADARAVDQAHTLGFGFVVVLAPRR